MRSALIQTRQPVRLVKMHCTFVCWTFTYNYFLAILRTLYDFVHHCYTSTVHAILQDPTVQKLVQLCMTESYYAPDLRQKSLSHCSSITISQYQLSVLQVNHMDAQPCTVQVLRKLLGTTSIIEQYTCVLIMLGCLGVAGRRRGRRACCCVVHTCQCLHRGSDDEDFAT